MNSENRKFSNNYTSALKNGVFFYEGSFNSDLTLIIQKGKIIDILKKKNTKTDLSFNLRGRIVTPGLIDLHIHGALGYSFNDTSPNAINRILNYCMAHGTTLILAAIATAPISEIISSLDLLRSWISSSENKIIFGVHLEGPYFNLRFCGAQDPNNVRYPNDGTAEALLNFSDIIKIFSLAPELPGSLELISKIKSLGIIPAAGHSNSNDKEFLLALQAGLKHVIHIWNAQSITVREGLWRVPGLAEASLTYDGYSVEMIGDNKHLPITLMKLAYKCIGPSRLCIISDATGAAGLVDGLHYRMANIEYEVFDGVGVTLDRTSFGGGATMLNQMIPILRDIVGIRVEEVVQMMTTTPSQILGISDRKGSLNIGNDADIVIFNSNFIPEGLIVDGNWIYGSELFVN